MFTDVNGYSTSIPGVIGVLLFVFCVMVALTGCAAHSCAIGEPCAGCFMCIN